MLIKKNRRKVQRLWLVITILGVAAMVFFTIAPIFR